MVVTPKTRRIVLRRQWGMCRVEWCTNKPLEMHHIYFKSQYKKDDRDEAWNLAWLCSKHHKDNVVWVHGSNTELREALVAQADRIKPPYERSLEVIKKERKEEVVLTDHELKMLQRAKQRDKEYRRQRAVAWKNKQDPEIAKVRKERRKRREKKYRFDKEMSFRATHNWFSPSQYNYRKQKDYLRNQRKLWRYL